MIDGWQADAYKTGLARIAECATELGRRKCDFIIHSGVPLVVSQGKGYEREVISKIETLTNAPATTSILAGMEALRTLSVRRVGLVNPYPSELNDAVVAFLEGHGFEVDAVVSLGVRLHSNRRHLASRRLRGCKASRQTVAQNRRAVSTLPAVSGPGGHQRDRVRFAASGRGSFDVRDLDGF
jgi:hypothetical protein